MTSVFIAVIIIVRSIHQTLGKLYTITTSILPQLEVDVDFLLRLGRRVEVHVNRRKS
jgi:hypothetical protein